MQQPESPILSPDGAFQGQSPGPTAARIAMSRVCDRCIRKKVKCDQGRPTCSRCFERGETCSYSAIRRKPGPLRGSRHAPKGSSSHHRSHVTPRPPDQESSPAGAAEHRVSQGQLSFSCSESSPETTGTRQRVSQPAVSPQQEIYLLEKYFDIVQDANPIFSRDRFLQRYRDFCSRDLISTICIITAKVTGFDLSVDGSCLDVHIDMLLSSSLLEVDMIGDSPSLDQFRKACLLAFYEFHQFPGHQSWLRIGRLTRMAYRVGLDRLENMRALYSDWKAVDEQDMQEWRTVWWCIYRLDSYSNLASGTPYLIEDDHINTALVQCRPANSPSDLYLPPRSEGLWRILPAVTSDTETSLRNIHIITVAAMRRAGLVSRVHLLRSQEETTARLTDIERHLCALRLALPPGWLNSRRNAFSGESQADHHARLITVLHLLMAQLLISVLSCSGKEDDELIMNWQRVLEACQDIGSTAAAWNSAFCPMVDPAISLTIFTALIFLDLHQKSTAISTPNLQPTIDHHQTVLRLQLEQFGSIWTLPRLLTLSFKGFSESVAGPLSPSHITLIMSRFEAPLHPRWLQFLSSTQSVLDAHG